MRQSILKKTPSVYEVKSDLTITNKENPLTNVSSMSTSKIVRFSGIDSNEEDPSSSNINNNQDDPNDESDTKSNVNNTENSSGFDEETTNELRKYYRKSRTLPFRQINLIGLNGEFIVAASPTNPLVPHFTTTAFGRQPKMFPRTKTMRIVSAKTHQPPEYRLARQNTCPNLSKTTPAATQLKAPMPKYELPNQAYYYWPNSLPPQQSQNQQSNQTHFMTNLQRSSINYSTQSNYIKSPSAPRLSSTTPNQLLNNTPLAYKSTGSSIPLLNNRFLNTNLFFSSSYSPSSPMISADKLVNIDPPVPSKLDSSISCSNIESYSNQLTNSNLLPSRSNSSNSLTLYTYLVQSTSNTNKSLKKEATKASLLRTHQAKKNSDSNPQTDLSRINNATTNDVAQHLAKSHKFSSLADNFLNASSITTSLSRTLNARRSVEPLETNLYDSHLPPATTTTTAATTGKTSLNGLYSPLRLRTTSANTISSTAIK